MIFVYALRLFFFSAILFKASTVWSGFFRIRLLSTRLRVSFEKEKNNDLPPYMMKVKTFLS